jgi:hypothetical protein
LTLRVEEAARLWCRSGLLYAGVDLALVHQQRLRQGCPAASAGAYMYLTGAGLPSSPLLGRSMRGRDV